METFGLILLYTVLALGIITLVYLLWDLIAQDIEYRREKKQRKSVVASIDLDDPAHQGLDPVIDDDTGLPTVRIRVKGGVVTVDEGLPHGIAVQIIDYDIDEEDCDYDEESEPCMIGTYIGGKY